MDPSEAQGIAITDHKGIKLKGIQDKYKQFKKQIKQRHHISVTRNPNDYLVDRKINKIIL